MWYLIVSIPDLFTITYFVFIVPAIGNNCTKNDDCTEDLLVCFDGICECGDGYFQSGISECSEGM